MADMKTDRRADGATNDPTDSVARIGEILMAQALDLSAMFDELVEHSANNFKDRPGTTHRYMQLALRAQSNCRTSLEAVARFDKAQHPGGEKRSGG